MTQKQIFGVVIGVTFVVVVFVFVYRQYASDTDKAGTLTIDTGATTQKQMTPTDSKKVIVPETIDDVALSIEAESSVDLSALDDEESSSLDAVNQDSDSVNNLGTSYDENSL